MKSKILYLIIFALVMTCLSGCDKDTTAGYTRITYYPTLEVLGDPVVIAPIGVEYVDAGVKSELLGEDVSNQVVVSSNVNTNVGGLYEVNYAITNADGYTRTASRTVYVADPTPSIISTGMHVVAPGTHRMRAGAKTDYSGYSILVLQTSPGVFFISDFLGGYYDQKAGYGSSYALTGNFKLNEDNTLTLIDSYLIGWGDSMDALSNGIVDPVTGTISWSASYAGMDFNVILKN